MVCLVMCGCGSQTISARSTDTTSVTGQTGRVKFGNDQPVDLAIIFSSRASDDDLTSLMHERLSVPYNGTGPGVVFREGIRDLEGDYSQHVVFVDFTDDATSEEEANVRTIARSDPLVEQLRSRVTPADLNIPSVTTTSTD
jgi:hypothetical protein